MAIAPDPNQSHFRLAKDSPDPAKPTNKEPAAEPAEVSLPKQLHMIPIQIKWAWKAEGGGVQVEQWRQ